MTREQLKTHLLYHARQMSTGVSNGVAVAYPSDKIDDFVETCIEAGMGDFWGARRWPFRRRSYTLPIAVSANPYTLPEDYAAISSIVDTSETYGIPLVSLDKETFDKTFPDPSDYAAGSARYFTVGLEQGENAWQIWFAPLPDVGDTVKLVYFTETPKDPSIIPDRYISGLIAACAKFLFRLGSKERHDAWMMAEAEYNRLETIPTFDAGLPDATGGVTTTPQPNWIDPLRP